MRLRTMAACLAFGLWANPALPDDRYGQVAEFHRLRQIKGHFQGGSEWIPDVDSWGCKKQQVMHQLQMTLGPGAREADILKLMEAPDERVKPGSLAWALVRPKQGDSMLIYYWRGKHDFLYFLLKKKTVLKTGWWMAGE